MRFSNEALLDDYKLGIITLEQARGVVYETKTG